MGSAKAVETPAGVEELRRIRRLLGGLLLIATFTAVYFARAVLLPVVLALVIALTLRPVARWLFKLGVPHWVSAIVLCFGLGVGAGAAIYVASGPVSTLADQAPQIGQEIRWKLRDVLASVDQVQRASKQVEDMAKGGTAAPQAQEVVVAQSGLVASVVGSLASAGTSLAVALVLAMFFLATADFHQQRLVEAVPRLTDKKRALAIVRGAERQISRYLGSIAVINAGLGLAIGLSLWFLGLANAQLWGLAAFLLNFLPFVGAIIGTAGVAVAAIVSFDHLPQAMLCPMVYLGLTALEGNLVTPALLGRRLAISTVAVLLTVLLWGWLWGVAGTFLAVPVLVIVKVISDNVPGMAAFSGFLTPIEESPLDA